MCEGNYIKLNRKLLDWEWFRNRNTCDTFIYCLLRANWKEGRFQGYVIQRGSFVTSYPRIAEDLNISIQSVRTAINHLKSTGELTVKITPKFSIITVVKYTDYQDINSQTNSQLTANQQSTNNNRRKKEGKKEIINTYSDIPTLNDEILKFKEHRKKLNKPMTDYAISLLINKLDKLAPGDITLQIKILEQSIDNGWQGIFPIKEVNKISKNNFNNINQRTYNFEDMERRLLRK